MSDLETGAQNSNYINDSGMEQLARLGKTIAAGLSCDINDTGVPCRTDRLAIVEAMKGYLRLHGYQVIDNWSVV
jgi:hypothetical protein